MIDLVISKRKPEAGKEGGETFELCAILPQENTFGKWKKVGSKKAVRRTREKKNFCRKVRWKATEKSFEKEKRLEQEKNDETGGHGLYQEKKTLDKI